MILIYRANSTPSPSAMMANFLRLESLQMAIGEDTIKEAKEGEEEEVEVEEEEEGPHEEVRQGHFICSAQT